MHPDVAALLEVQTEDVVIRDLESRLAHLAPRLAAMEKEIERANAAVTQARQNVEAEERRQRDIQGRVSQHRQLQERNQAQLNTIADARQAAAAMAQLEQARHMTDEDDREARAIADRLNELRSTLHERENAVADLRTTQEQARASLDADSAEIRQELEGKRTERAEKAKHVPRSLLSRYERIAQRHVHALVAVRGQSCGNCDTAIPLQRRSAMAGSGQPEVCEGCGVLLYAVE